MYEESSEGCPKVFLLFVCLSFPFSKLSHLSLTVVTCCRLFVCLWQCFSLAIPWEANRGPYGGEARQWPQPKWEGVTGVQSFG